MGKGGAGVRKRSYVYIYLLTSLSRRISPIIFSHFSFVASCWFSLVVNLVATSCFLSLFIYLYINLFIYVVLLCAYVVIYQLSSLFIYFISFYFLLYVPFFS